MATVQNGRTGTCDARIPRGGPTMRRLTGIVAGAVAAAVLGLATPAAAHVSVSADTVQPGAADVTLRFTAAAGSDTSGITTLRVTLPSGIDPGGVRLADGPPGWRLRATGTGFRVSGSALRPGADARYAVTVTRLPTGQDRLYFPTEQVYANGRTDRWTDPGDNATSTGAHPAPVLDLTGQVTRQPDLVSVSRASPAGNPRGLLIVAGVGLMLILVGAVAVLASRSPVRR